MNEGIDRLFWNQILIFDARSAVAELCFINYCLHSAEIRTRRIPIGFKSQIKIPFCIRAGRHQRVHLQQSNRLKMKLKLKFYFLVKQVPPISSRNRLSLIPDVEDIGYCPKISKRTILTFQYALNDTAQLKRNRPTIFHFVREYELESYYIS